jgi:hypothetical protein
VERAVRSILGEQSNEPRSNLLSPSQVVVEVVPRLLLALWLQPEEGHSEHPRERDLESTLTGAVCHDILVEPFNWPVFRSYGLHLFTFCSSFFPFQRMLLWSSRMSPHTSPRTWHWKFHAELGKGQSGYYFAGFGGQCAAAPATRKRRNNINYSSDLQKWD